MTPSLIHEPIAKLPIYQDGFRRGTDLGLRLALETIVKEAARQQDLAAIANATVLPGDAFRVASRHQYALGRLSDVAAVVAVYFRATH
jgi:hypothetical protein